MIQIGKARLIAIIGLLIFATTSICFFYFYIDCFMHSKGQSDTEHLIFIKKGTSFSTLTQTLYQLKLIKHPRLFIFYAKYHDLTKRIKAGQYSLKESMAPLEILDILVQGKEFLRKFTVPEGLTCNEVAHLWEKSGFGTAVIFLNELENFRIDYYDYPDTGWEGYLFPNTYYISSFDSPKTVIAQMITKFFEVFNSQLQQEGHKYGLSTHQLVTLASLIEKETSIDTERPLISSVFHNRLKAGMPLQCDPTIIYALGNRYQGTLLKKHLKIGNPYNTYLNVGLPPGPIANPGQASIYAACHPAETKFLYFVANGKGGHIFSTTLNKHNKAVRNWRKHQAKSKTN